MVLTKDFNDILYKRISLSLGHGSLHSTEAKAEISSLFVEGV